MPTEIDLASVYQVVLCVLLPPVAVWLHAGECSIHVLVTFLLWMLFVVPGIVYAVGFCFFRALFIHRSRAISEQKPVDRNVYF